MHRNNLKKYREREIINDRPSAVEDQSQTPNPLECIPKTKQRPIQTQSDTVTTEKLTKTRGRPSKNASAKQNPESNAKKRGRPRKNPPKLKESEESDSEDEQTEKEESSMDRKIGRKFGKKATESREKRAIRVVETGRRVRLPRKAKGDVVAS